MLSPDQIYQYQQPCYVIPDYRLSAGTIVEMKMMVCAIIENDAYIFTHLELEGALDKRCAGISRSLEK